MYDFIKVCMKMVKDKNGRSFPTYFGYRYEADKDSNMTDKSNGKSFKIKLTNELAKRLEDTKDVIGNYPYFMALDRVDAEDYFITKDKRLDGTPRLDKNGVQHKIMVIRNYRDIQEAPKEELTIDDLD